MTNHQSRPGSSRQMVLAAILVTVLTLASALAGCGGDDGETGTDESSAADQPDGTTDQAGGSGGGTDVETPTDDPPSGGLTTNELAEGSGCTPGTETGLPDGRWYGLVDVVDDRRVDFDLACRFIGAVAAVAATEDGEESPPNDYYVRNANPLIRTLEVAGGAMVTWYPDPGDPASVETVSFDEWVTGLGGRDGELGVWIETADGAITAIEEQWVP